MMFYIKLILILIIYINNINCNNNNNNINDVIIGIKDGSLNYLIDIFNNNTNIFNAWDFNNITINQINIFINTIEKWITSTTPIITTTTTSTTIINTNSIQLNCMNNRYSNVLTGIISKKPKIIIDFIPFGYDTTKLLIRLHETYDIIHCDLMYLEELSYRTRFNTYTIHINNMYYNCIYNKCIIYHI
jgi:hypothetical protein